MKKCFCGGSKPFSVCCGPIIKGLKADSAEKLMRSRYSAYVTRAIDYIIETTYPSKRQGLVRKEIDEWAKTNVWQQLEIVSSSEFIVEFKAYFKDRKGKTQVHYEKSMFVFENNTWYYLKGEFPGES